MMKKVRGMTDMTDVERNGHSCYHEQGQAERAVANSNNLSFCTSAQRKLASRYSSTPLTRRTRHRFANEGGNQEKEGLIRSR